MLAMTLLCGQYQDFQVFAEVIANTVKALVCCAKASNTHYELHMRVYIERSMTLGPRKVKDSE